MEAGLLVAEISFTRKFVRVLPSWHIAVRLFGLAELIFALIDASRIKS